MFDVNELIRTVGKVDKCKSKIRDLFKDTSTFNCGIEDLENNDRSIKKNDELEKNSKRL